MTEELGGRLSNRIPEGDSGQSGTDGTSSQEYQDWLSRRAYHSTGFGRITDIHTPMPVTAQGDGLTTSSTIGGKTPAEIGDLIQEHFDTVTPEQFEANNRRANPHMYPETSRVDGA
jgi:hypothetical protein